MKNDFKVLKLTPDHRMWRIDWLGELHFPHYHGGSQPSIYVSISPLQCDVNQNDALLSPASTILSQQRRVSVKLGLLPLIKIGDVWQNGYCVSSPEYQGEQFKDLSIDKTTIKRIKAGFSIDDAFILPLQEHPWHANETKSFCICISLPDERRIVIPCLELIRFYFGSSSRFLHLLFTKRIEGSDFWEHMHFNEGKKHLHLKLAKELNSYTAGDVGRIALDSKAWSSARLIYSSCMVSSLANEMIYPYTYFPFMGKTDLICTGKWLSEGSRLNSTFLVFNIKSCSHLFPFNSLSYELQKNQKITRHKSEKNNQNLYVNKTANVMNINANSSHTLTDKDPSKTKATKDFLIDGLVRFPDLSRKRVWCEKYETEDPPAKILVNSEAKIEEIGVGQSSYEKSNQSVSSIEVGCVSNRLKINEIDPKRYKFVVDGAALALKQMNLQVDKVSTELVTLPGYTHPVIALPQLVDEDGVIDAISFCKGRGGIDRVRRCCFIDITDTASLHHQVFIVEPQNYNDVLRAIPIIKFELKHAIKVLHKHSVKHSEKTKIQLSDPKGGVTSMMEGLTKFFYKIIKVS